MQNHTVTSGPGQPCPTSILPWAAGGTDTRAPRSRGWLRPGGLGMDEEGKGGNEPSPSPPLLCLCAQGTVVALGTPRKALGCPASSTRPGTAWGKLTPTHSRTPAGRSPPPGTASSPGAQRRASHGATEHWHKPPQPLHFCRRCTSVTNSHHAPSARATLGEGMTQPEHLATGSDGIRLS